MEGQGAVEKESSPKDLKFFDRTRGRTFIHPGSVNFSVGKFTSGWLVYTQVRGVLGVRGAEGRPGAGRQRGVWAAAWMAGRASCAARGRWCEVRSQLWRAACLS